MGSTILFSSVDFSDALYGHEQKMLKEIDAFQAARIVEEDVESLSDHFEKEYWIQVPKIDEAGISVDQEEAKVDVRRTPNRYLYDTRRTTHIQGTKLTFFAPFQGDKELFKCRPSAFNFNPPHAKVNSDQLELSYSVTDQNSAAVRTQFDRDLAQIKQWLSWIEADVQPFNSKVRAKARERVEMRKRKLLKDRELASGLGFPTRSKTSQTNVKDSDS